MKRWMIMAAPLLLAACAGPRVVPTFAGPHSIELLVQGAKIVPMQDVDDLALRHCADYGLVSRRTQAEWISDTSMTFHFECEGPHKTVSEKVADKKAPKPPEAEPKPLVVRSGADRKQAAWSQANALSPGWAKCIVDRATQVARETGDSADNVAITVAASCSQWENNVQAVLRGAGEEDSEFQVALHKQIIEFAAARILSVRADPVPGPALSSTLLPGPSN